MAKERSDCGHPENVTTHVFLNVIVDSRFRHSQGVKRDRGNSYEADWITTSAFGLLVMTKKELLRPFTGARNDRYHNALKPINLHATRLIKTKIFIYIEFRSPYLPFHPYLRPFRQQAYRYLTSQTAYQ